MRSRRAWTPSVKPLQKTGSVIVTGCLGAKAGTDGANLVRQVHPKVLAVTGPHATQEVMDAVHANLPKPHDPFIDLVPQAFGVAGIKLTPRHYAYLKISEGCNHRCTFCIIPSMRGDLVSRPVGDVLAEARALFEGGVKELLIVSQDTSAYGVDVQVPHRILGRQAGASTRMLELVQALGDIAEVVRRLGPAALCVPLPQRGRRHSADGVRQGAALPGRAAAA
jgi:ribosomal protein S12 methylthiotransferase